MFLCVEKLNRLEGTFLSSACKGGWCTRFNYTFHVLVLKLQIVSGIRCSWCDRAQLSSWWHWTFRCWIPILELWMSCLKVTRAQCLFQLEMSLKAVRLTWLMDSDALPVGVGGLILAADVSCACLASEQTWWLLARKDWCAWVLCTGSIGLGLRYIVISSHLLTTIYRFLLDI